MAFADKLRLSIEEVEYRQFLSVGNALVTASIAAAGGAAFRPTEIEGLIGGSDTALHAAKRNGRI
jgi:PleD family two-component response regulator